MARIDLDGDDNDDLLEFYRNSGTNELRRIFNNNPVQGDTLASDLTDLTFSFYDENDSQLATPVGDCSQIFRIEIVLTLSRGNQVKTLRSQIFPRNL